MEMTNQEIVKKYFQNPCSKQITVIADLNGCERKEIIKILRDCQVELPRIPSGRPKKNIASGKKICSAERTKKDEIQNSQIKVCLDEQKIEVKEQPVPKYLIPESIRKITQAKIDEIQRTMFIYYDKLDELNKEKKELESFLKGDFRDHGEEK